MSKIMSGAKNCQWKGGIKPIHHRIRHSWQYRLWRTLIFKRDNYICQECGRTRGGRLEADHIKVFSLHPESRFDLNNGRTLCIECHRKTPTWGSHKGQGVVTTII
jgi:5-methylcytosine-specific restriction endonuclease McrA